MVNKQLERVGPGFYWDRAGALHVDVGEFMGARGIPDCEEGS